jgi:hypothetical protein
LDLSRVTEHITLTYTAVCVREQDVYGHWPLAGPILCQSERNVWHAASESQNNLIRMGALPVSTLEHHVAAPDKGSSAHFLASAGLSIIAYMHTTLLNLDDYLYAIDVVAISRLDASNLLLHQVEKRLKLQKSILAQLFCNLC